MHRRHRAVRAELQRRQGKQCARSSIRAKVMSRTTHRVQSGGRSSRLAGSLLAEISLPKLIAAWTILILLPALLLGAAPLLASIWISAVSSKVAAIYTGLLPPLLLAILIAVGWFGGKPLWRLIETNFWSLNALAVQPAYALSREALRQLAERFLPAARRPTRARSDARR